MLLPTLARSGVVLAEAVEKGASLHAADTGLAVYGCALVGLVAWEQLVLPAMRHARTRRIPWITPLTADCRVPPPLLVDLRRQGSHLVGVRDGVPQYITCDLPPGVLPSLITRSEEWSRYYDTVVYLYKLGADTIF